MPDYLNFQNPSLFTCCNVLDKVQARCRIALLQDIDVLKSLSYITMFARYGTVKVSCISRWLPRNYDSVFPMYCTAMTLTPESGCVIRRKAEKCFYPISPRFVVHLTFDNMVGKSHFEQYPFRTQGTDETGAYIILPEIDLH